MSSRSRAREVHTVLFTYTKTHFQKYTDIDESWNKTAPLYYLKVFFEICIPLWTWCLFITKSNLVHSSSAPYAVLWHKWALKICNVKQHLSLLLKKLISNWQTHIALPHRFQWSILDKSHLKNVPLQVKIVI
jgi:hypothetical protein